MSYTPTNWKTGDIVTSAKLNKLENGVATAGGVLVVNANESGVLDHTWQEIADNKFAVLNGQNGAVYYLVQISINPHAPYAIVFLNLATSTPTPAIFTTESADGYPVYNSGNGNGNGSGSGT